MVFKSVRNVSYFLHSERQVETSSVLPHLPRLGESGNFNLRLVDVSAGLTTGQACHLLFYLFLVF